jgi:IclR family KDG regulon transcriptional repressor
MVKREKANYLIQSVSHAIDVLEELVKSGQEIGVTELSKRLKLHKNNVFRLLATLELRGYVEQNKDTEDYRLSVRCLQLGQSFIQQSTLVSRAFPILRQAAETLGETVSFATLKNNQVYFPVTVESKKAVKVTSRNGSVIGAKNCAVGRLLLAQVSDASLAEILSSNTPQDAAIKNQLGELRSTGQVIDKGVTEADVVTVSKLVRGAGGEIVGSIEILVPQYRAKLEQIQPILDAAVVELSTSLGAVAKGLVSAIEKEVSSDSAAKEEAVNSASVIASSQINQALLGRIART